MNYFHPYAPSLDETIITAWDSQVAETPWLAPSLAAQTADLFPRFAVAYAQLRALPRGARRALQRQLAHSQELATIPSEWQQKLARSLAGAALLLALSHGVAQANTITVNTNVPKIITDGKCSLVEAIINANNDAATHVDCAAGSGADTIVLPAASVHTVLTDYDFTYGATRLPAITSQITIQGNGSTINRKKSKLLSRLIAVAASGDLTLDRVTLSGGGQYNGGAIINLGSLTATNSTISGNTAVKGGGIYNAGGALSVEEALFTKNAGVYGAGIFDYSGTTDIEQSTFTGNRTVYGGAAVYGRFGTVTIQNSTITGNRASRAAIYNQGGILEIHNTIITKNSASEHGGGVMSNNNRSFSPPPCSVTIENSTISANAAHYDGGGIENESCTLVVSNSTISANKSGTGAGGISTGFAPSLIENSTISANSGRYTGGVYGATITVTNSTITGNRAKLVGGVYNRGDMTVKRTIVSGNKGPVGEALSNPSGTMTVDNFNLFGTNGNAGVSGFTAGASDIIPGAGVLTGNILAPLANNGGPTQTHALVAGSPAIDASPVDADCPSSDQRGTLRPQGPLCDIGAFEK
ncbi:MAG TPA: right-handed parallel beta-helix repeat-containing protein [Candidatus Binatia bacterium]